QAEDGIRDFHVTGVQTCALPIYGRCLIIQYRTHGEEVAADNAGIGGSGAQSAEVLGDAHVAVGQVVPVEYDALRVDLGPAHPQRGAETEILSLHAAVLSPRSEEH